MSQHRTGRPRAPALALLASSLALALPRPALAASAVERLQEFELDEVRVTDPYYRNLFDKEVAYLAKLDPDRLLAAFKAVSEGRDPGNAPGINLYGGWEGGWSLLRGHTLGHYLSAMARAHRQTRGSDPALNDLIATRLELVVARLKAFQDRSSGGYVFGSPESHFDVIEGKAGGSSWAPWYTMHKIVAGLIDVHRFTGNATALQVASRLGDWAFARTSRWDPALRARVLGVEYGGMNDCLYELYKLTGNPDHLAAAHRFDEESLFTPISRGTDVLAGLHANTQIPKFIGALNRYRTLGAAEDHYLTVAEQFWAVVLKDHTYVTGGNSQLEHFGPAGKLNAGRDNTNNESCNSYNMLKLTRELFKSTGDVKYAEYYEQAHLNEVMSSVNPTDGMTTYFKPMGTGYFKLFGTEETFWCCNGTGMENYVKLNDSLYFHDATDLYVNMYVSSALTWTARGLSLSATAELPASERVAFVISSAPAEVVKIRFRRPSWIASCRSMTVAVNGKRFAAPQVNGYLEVARAWKAGDRIEVKLPMEVRASRLPDDRNVVAFTYGPVVLSAGLGTERMVSEGQWASAKATIPPGVVIKDTIRVNAGTAVDDWVQAVTSNLVRTPGKVEFTLRNTDEDGHLRFTPHYQRYEDRYGIYFRLVGSTGGGAAAAGECPPDPDAVTTGDQEESGSSGGTSGSGGGASGSGGATSGSSGGASGSSGGASGSGGTPEAATLPPTTMLVGSCGCSSRSADAPGAGGMLLALLGLAVSVRPHRPGPSAGRAGQGSVPLDRMGEEP